MSQRMQATPDSILDDTDLLESAKVEVPVDDDSNKKIFIKKQDDMLDLTPESTVRDSEDDYYGIPRNIPRFSINENANARLIEASRDGCEEETEKLINLGADIDSTDNNGCTSLILASKHGHKGVAGRLVAVGADVNAKTNDGRTALHLAIEHEHEDMTGLLLFAGAEVDWDTHLNWLTDAKYSSYWPLLSYKVLMETVDPYDTTMTQRLLTSMLTSEKENINDALLEEVFILIDLGMAFEKEDREALRKAIVKGEVFPGGFCQPIFLENSKVFLTSMDSEIEEDSAKISLYFVSREVFIALTKEELSRPGGLPSFQELRAEGKLELLQVEKENVLSGGLRAVGRNILTLSYPWQAVDDPDSTNDRYAVAMAQLTKHPELTHVWWDYMSLPQSTKNKRYIRNRFEEWYFRYMLKEGVSLLYISTTVLCIVNASYTQRFWTQYEAFLATRELATHGFVPSTRRILIVCLQNAGSSDEEQRETLLTKWLDVEVDEALRMLAEPDVAVTDAADKKCLLEKLPELDRYFIQIMNRSRRAVEDDDTHPDEVVSSRWKVAGFPAGPDDVTSLRDRINTLETENTTLSLLEKVATLEAENMSLKLERNQDKEALEAAIQTLDFSDAKKFRNLLPQLKEASSIGYESSSFEACCPMC